MVDSGSVKLDSGNVLREVYGKIAQKKSKFTSKITFEVTIYFVQVYIYKNTIYFECKIRLKGGICNNKKDTI